MDPALYSHELHDPATNKGIEIIDRAHFLRCRVMYAEPVSCYSSNRMGTLAAT